MTLSLATQFSHADLEVDCPSCGYLLWVIWAEVVTHAAVICPCCRDPLWLRDADGSMQNADEVIEQQITDVLKGLM